ncbi:hypothetical protein [Clostridium aminobutyricum]|uniref:DUF5610 domain-containing protein n=1 Tax=Clostridium aminobutyricum TaxID=33953 RepID=A0A939D7B0_CLOAM|nr:hypothetical protein [Clostridium aminobutyricum]MBN7772839.1 hypothetical protein [Clostridium aminobutyricum]
MNINGVNSYYKQTFQNSSATSGAEKSEQLETKITSGNKDTIEISANQVNEGKNAYKLTDQSNSTYTQNIETLKSEYDRQVKDFKDMLRKMIAQQSTINGGVTETHFNFSFGVNLDIQYSSSNTQTSDSLSGFGEDDYWGAEQTANRIFDFAVSLAGDNDELLSTLRDSVKEGFNQVEKLFGGAGKLPSVCYDTLDRINELFDQRLQKQDTNAQGKSEI